MKEHLIDELYVYVSVDSSTELKEHLIDELDYILLHKEAWDKLLAWYGMISNQVSVGSVVNIRNECLFSSPEPKAQVSYCHSEPSVVRPSVRRRPPSVNFHIFNFFSRTA